MTKVTTWGTCSDLFFRIGQPTLYSQHTVVSGTTMLSLTGNRVSNCDELIQAVKKEAVDTYKKIEFDLKKNVDALFGGDYFLFDLLDETLNLFEDNSGFITISNELLKCNLYRTLQNLNFGMMRGDDSLTDIHKKACEKFLTQVIEKYGCKKVILYKFLGAETYVDKKGKEHSVPDLDNVKRRNCVLEEYYLFIEETFSGIQIIDMMQCNYKARENNSGVNPFIFEEAYYERLEKELARITSNSNFVPQDDGVYKLGKHYLIYSLKQRKSEKLYIVFSGMVSNSPGLNTMSYYNFRDSLDGNVLHIMDHFGAHGTYLLGVSGDITIREAVIQLIKDIAYALDISEENLHLLGTSKGGTSAIAYGLMLGYGNVIAGEPQIRVGDFLFTLADSGFESARSIIYTITRRVNRGDRELLNQMIEDIFMNFGLGFRGKIEVISGEATGYFDEYSIRYGIDKTNIKVSSLEISTHNEVVPPFCERVLHNSSLQEYGAKHIEL